MFEIFKYSHKLIIKNFPNLYILIYFFLFITSFFQLFGTISIIPVITILLAPDLVFGNDFVNQLFDFSEYKVDDLKLIFGIFFLIFSFLSQIILFSSKILIRYISSLICLNMRRELYLDILRQRMSIFLRYDTSNISNIFGAEVEKVNDYITSYLSIISDLLIISIIMLGIVFVEPKISYGLAVMGLFFVILYFVCKKKLIKISFVGFEIANKFNAIGSIISLGFKEVILFNLRKKIFTEYDSLKKKFITNDIKGNFLLGFPRHLIEFLIFLLMVLYFLNISKEITLQQIPIYGFYFLAVWKCIPSAFGLYRSFSNIQRNISSFKTISSLKEKVFQKAINVQKNDKINDFKKTLKINNIRYSYPNSKKDFNFNFKINKGSKVLITGKSGSGKTTLMNIMCGLLKPDLGTIFIDEKDINKDLNGYLNVLGFDTQFNYFINNTVAGNICFKKKLNKKELVKLKTVYKVCGINNITNSFENMFKHKLKLNAPEISGGQRQRIALARALYRRPKILLLDESLNSLDRKSEIEIFSNIIKNFSDITLIVTSHKPVKKIFNKLIKI